ncbi:MAG: tetratricopeptide repeat protein [Planctomycetales bacterium]|nr:tetratricopeptide repeat protein [Planctomycetales bacterium]
MPTGPRAFLTDFGLAKSVATGSKLTRTGQALGTPAYMSPEQARGETSSLAAATDVWGLGCVLYEMLAGRRPFAGETAPELLARILEEDPRPLRAARPDVPRGLEVVVGVALGKAPRSRYAEIAALRDDLDRVLRGELPSARQARRRRRGPLLLAGVAAAGLAGVAGAVVVGSRGPADPGSRATSPPPASVAEALAGQARRLRFSDPRGSARLLAQAIGEAEDHPRREAWRLERGLLLWSTGEGAAAHGEWGRIPPGAPEAPAARLYRGLERLFERDVEAALAELDLVSAVDQGGSREPRLARAAILTVRGTLEEAREALQGEEGWEAAILRAATHHFDPAGDRAAAAREYTRALEEGLPFAWLYLNRGVARQELRELGPAIEDFTEALRIRPDWPSALGNRALARGERGDKRGALGDYEAVARLRPEDPDFRYNVGVLRHDLGDAAGAIAEYDLTLRLLPDDPVTLTARGDSKTALGDLRGAIEDYSAAIRSRPDHANAWNNRGAARHTLGQHLEAIADLNESLRLEPDDPAALNNRANARASLGRMEEALADWDEALRLRPDHPAALAARGLALTERGQPERGLPDFEASLRLRPDHPETLVHRADARRRLGDLGGALADVEAALRIRPGYAYALAHLGCVREDLEDLPGAAEAWAEFLRVAPGDPQAKEVREWLAKCRERIAAAGRPGK